jgi:hypothetical protein
MAPYDRRVPVLVLPPGRARHSALAAPETAMIPMTRIATMLARWLGVMPPASLRRTIE